MLVNLLKNKTAIIQNRKLFLTTYFIFLPTHLTNIVRSCNHYALVIIAQNNYNVFSPFA